MADQEGKIQRRLGGRMTLLETADALARHLPVAVVPRRGTAVTAAPAWIRAAAETLAPPGALRVVATEGPSGTTAVAPLVAASRRGVERLEALGLAALGEPFDVLAPPEGDLEALAAAVARLGRPLGLGRVAADAPFLAALSRALGRAGRLVLRPRSGTPMLPLDASWAEPLAHLSSRRRADLRRAERRASEEGPLDLRVHAPGPDRIEALLGTVLDVEARSWRAARGGAIAQDPLRGPFFLRFARLAAQAGILRLGLLTIGGRPAAMQYAVAWAGGYWLLKIGYDEAYARCSPGVLLTVASIAHAVAEGLSTYEFLGVREDWTSLWATRERACVAAYAYPPGLRGRTTLALDAAGALAAKARARLARGADRGEA